MSSSLENEGEISFSILKPLGVSIIPKNYYCRWNVQINVDS